MKSTKYWLAIAGFSVLTLAGCSAPPTAEFTARGYVELSNEELERGIDLDGLATYGRLVFYKDYNYRNALNIFNGVTGFEQGQAQSIYPNGVTAVRVTLPKDAIVLMFEHKDLGGVSCPIIPGHSIPDLDEKYGPSGFNDFADCWSWYRLSTSPRPPFTEAIPDGSLPEGTVEFFETVNLGTRFDAFQISAIPAAREYPMYGPRDGDEKRTRTWSPRRDNNARSVRWNLPKRVVVMLFTHGTGEGRPIALWGSGKINDLSSERWGMSAGSDDGLSSVSWYDLR